MGRPAWSTLINWLNHGVLSWPIAALLAASFGAPGVIYGQAIAGTIAGTLAAWWGWTHVRSLMPEMEVETPPPRPYPNPDRYRIR